VAPRPVTTQGYSVKPSSPPYDNHRSAPYLPINPLLPAASPTSPTVSDHKPSQPLRQSTMKSKMQPVIAELAARGATASVSSSADGYYSVDETTAASTPITFQHSTRPLAYQYDNQKIIRSPSRQDSYLTSSAASTMSGGTTVAEGASLDFQQRMFRAVDGRSINSPRYSTRKSKAYGNMLKDDVGGTLRASRDDSVASKEVAYSLPSKAVSTSNLLQDMPLVSYKKNPAIRNSQPSLAVLERAARKPRPPSFVQALETTDSIEQLTLLDTGHRVAGLAKGGHVRRERTKRPLDAQFGEISV
jgi:hypothetical protein